MSFTRSSTGLLVAATLLAGCAAPVPGGDAPGLNAELIAELDDVDASIVGASVNAFGFDLLGELTDGQQNTITSPVSVAAVLAMVLAGAGGQTAAEMAEVLHLDDSRDVRVGALLETLVDTGDVTLTADQALWADPGFPLEADYLSFVRDRFGATLETADLGSPETADVIDGWVSDHTEGRIDEIAADLGLPDPAAMLVLLNATYFLGRWSTSFDPDATVDQPFTLGDGSQATVPMMHLRGQELPYTQRDGYQMLRLPYGQQGRYAMEVLLPDADSNLGQLLASLDETEWRTAVDNLTEQSINVALPRFELEWGRDLTEPLTRLGMGSAFGLAADFRPMSPANPFLSTVVHKTYLRVDEEGTEAAAATGAAMALCACGTDFVVDRPFAFTISDTQTGTILFLGAITDPRGQTG